MGLDFYLLPGSPPCNAVQMTAKAIGVELNLKPVDMFAGEHLKPEYGKINPQRVVPTLVTEDGAKLSESRAICVYLIEKYAKNDSLYPKDPLKRAVINARLYFDIGTLYSRLQNRYYPSLFPAYKGRIVPNAEESLQEALGILNTFLDGNDFVAGNEYTVADISLLATFGTLRACDGDFSSYPNIVAWHERAKAVTPGNDINEKHSAAFKKFFG